MNYFQFDVSHISLEIFKLVKVLVFACLANKFSLAFFLLFFLPFVVCPMTFMTDNIHFS